jgi:hypothetical protein
MKLTDEDYVFIKPFSIEGFSKYTNTNNHSIYRMTVRTRREGRILYYDMFENEVKDIIKELEELIK